DGVRQDRVLPAPRSCRAGAGEPRMAGLPRTSPGAEVVAAARGRADVRAVVTHTAAHAVRAMILYPLNALVEDQLRRLRKTLDNTDFHTWLDRRPNPGNRILFDRYTGQTPVPGRELKPNGEPNDTALEKLRERLR